MDKDKEALSEVQQVVEVMGNSILICAPNGIALMPDTSAKSFGVTMDKSLTA